MGSSILQLFSILQVSAVVMSLPYQHFIPAVFVVAQPCCALLPPLGAELHQAGPALAGNESTEQPSSAHILCEYPAVTLVSWSFHCGFLRQGRPRGDAVPTTTIKPQMGQLFGDGASLSTTQQSSQTSLDNCAPRTIQKKPSAQLRSKPFGPGPAKARRATPSATLPFAHHHESAGDVWVSILCCMAPSVVGGSCHTLPQCYNVPEGRACAGRNRQPTLS